MDAAARADLCLRYGLPGDPIQGSNLLRAYCARCGEPIRVPVGAGLHGQRCRDCRHARRIPAINQPRGLRQVPQ